MAVANPSPDRPAALIAPPRPRKRAVAAPSLAVVVVNFCQWRNTARLAAQLADSAAFRAGRAEVVVVDNHSPGHPVARQLRRRGITVVRNGANVGFARAVNRGVRVTDAEWILLLNPDVTVPPGFLDRVLSAANKAGPRDGVVGFRLVNRDGSPQASCGEFPTLAGTARGLASPRAVRKGVPLPGRERRPVDWVTGGCLLARRACLDELGGLDEQFFLYYEDVDLCRRAAQVRWGVWFDPSASATHHWPLHARQVPAPLRLVTRHALLTYARAHWRPWQVRALGAVVWLEALARQWRTSDRDSAASFVRLRALVGELRRGDRAAEAQAIRFAAAQLGGVAAAQDGRTA